jgi:predicted DCC family thiol-disulfide oxidoreductase YuxK
MGEGLGWPWAVAEIGPRPFRNSGYEMLAANRLRFFGRRETRFVPTPDIAARFLR